MYKTYITYIWQDLQLRKKWQIGQLTMQQLHVLYCSFRFYNCTNCDQLHTKICPARTHTATAAKCQLCTTLSTKLRTLEERFVNTDRTFSNPGLCFSTSPISEIHHQGGKWQNE